VEEVLNNLHEITTNVYDFLREREVDGWSRGRVMMVNLVFLRRHSGNVTPSFLIPLAIPNPLRLANPLCTQLELLSFQMGVSPFS